MHSFKVDKGTQALNYFATKEGKIINKMKAIKLLWITDRYHLRKYGRSVTDDSYIAMKYGPVGSCAKDIAQQSVFCNKDTQNYSNLYIKPKGHNYESTGDIDLDVFSKSDVEALDFAYENFGKFDQFKLATISHAYPEWKKHENVSEMCIEGMSYLDFFDDPDLDDPNLSLLSNKDPFSVTTPSTERSRELYKELKNIEQILY